MSVRFRLDGYEEMARIHVTYVVGRLALWSAHRVPPEFFVRTDLQAGLAISSSRRRLNLRESIC
jgi:hypothetical protein